MNKKGLICITTCNRLNEVKKYILPYINFCNNNHGFDFLLALDGNNIEYIDFCNKFQIPLLYSEEREGVGLSKNRVLLKFPDYKYYFFLDDDIELIDSTVFFDNIYISDSLNIPHLSGIVFGEELTSEIFEKYKLTKGYRAGGYFNFFNAGKLFKIGGWHTHFAQYKRYGHSEHSYRFLNAGFQDYPLITIDSTIQKLAVHNPPHVTNEEGSNLFDHFHPDEQELINNKLTYFPLTTISAYHFNGYDKSFNKVVEDFLNQNKQKYPLVRGRVRFVGFAEYYFFKFSNAKSFGSKFYYFCASFACHPFNNQIKHYIKQVLKKT